MADDTVTMRATQPHTYLGHTYAVGDIFEAEAIHVDTIEVQGKGVRADTPKAAEKPAAKKK